MGISNTCQYCNETYIAERKTSKFCSTACRVANHRAKTRLKDNYKELTDMLITIARGLESIDTCHAAAIDLSTIRKTVDMYFPPNTRWWRCANCNQAVMKFMPTEQDCQCAEHAKWYVHDFIQGKGK